MDREKFKNTLETTTNIAVLLVAVTVLSILAVCFRKAVISVSKFWTSKGKIFQTSSQRRLRKHGNQFRYRAKIDDAKHSQVGRWAWDVFLGTK